MPEEEFSIQPVIGYRSWPVSALTNREWEYKFRSWPVSASANGEWEYDSSGWANAMCRVQPKVGIPAFAMPHVVPSYKNTRCACGFHAFHRPEDIAQFNGIRSVFGVVEGAGLVRIHEYGWRAERARILALSAFDEESIEWIKSSITSLRVPVLPLQEMVKRYPPQKDFRNPEAKKIFQDPPSTLSVLAFYARDYSEYCTAKFEAKNPLLRYAGRSEEFFFRRDENAPVPLLSYSAPGIDTEYIITTNPPFSSSYSLAIAYFKEWGHNDNYRHNILLTTRKNGLSKMLS